MNNVELKERIRYFIKQQLDYFPGFYMAILERKYRNHWFDQRLVKNSTDLVIEGFPRSANSFAVQAFKLSQAPKEVKIATHVHSPSHIIKATKLKRPVLILIRDPKSTLISLRALSMQGYKGQPDDLLQFSFDHLARYYISFYKKIINYQDKVIFGEFKQVTSDFNLQIKRINKNFGTDFLLYDNESISNEAIFEKGGAHLSPNKERNNYKSKLEESFENYCSPKLRIQMYDIYDKVLKIIDQY